MTLGDPEQEALADASRQVLQHVDGTLAAVSGKIYELLLAADIDLSEDDIRELLGEQPSASKSKTNTTAVLPTVGEDQPTADTASAVSTEENLAWTLPAPTQEDESKNIQNYLPPSPVPEYTTTTANTSSNDADALNVLPQEVPEDNSSLSSSDNEEDEIKSVATTATRRELKTRVGSLENTMMNALQQMQELDQRVAAAQEQEKAKHEAQQQEHDTALQESQLIIQELETKLQQTEIELEQKKARAQQVAESKARLEKAQEEKRALQEKTAALEQKIATLCEALLQGNTGSGGVEMASKPVLAQAVARAQQHTRSNPVAMKEDEKEHVAAAADKANFLRVLAIFSIVLAAFFIAKSAGERRYGMQDALEQPPAATMGGQSTDNGMAPPVGTTNSMPSELPQEQDDDDDDDIPVLDDLVEDFLKQVEDEPTPKDTTVGDETQVENQDKQLVKRDKKNIVVRILRGIKTNTTKIWGKIKGIGDDIPNLVREMD